MYCRGVTKLLLEFGVLPLPGFEVLLPIPKMGGLHILDGVFLLLIVSQVTVPPCTFLFYDMLSGLSERFIKSLSFDLAKLTIAELLASLSGDRV